MTHRLRSMEINLVPTGLANTALNLMLFRMARSCKRTKNGNAPMQGPYGLGCNLQVSQTVNL